MKCFKYEGEYVLWSASPSFLLLFLSVYLFFQPCQRNENFEALPSMDDLVPVSRDYRVIDTEWTLSTIMPTCCDHVTRFCSELLGHLSIKRPSRDCTYPPACPVKGERNPRGEFWIAKIKKRGSFLSGPRSMKTSERIVLIRIWNAHWNKENGKICRPENKRIQWININQEMKRFLHLGDTELNWPTNVCTRRCRSQAISNKKKNPGKLLYKDFRLSWWGLCENLMALPIYEFTRHDR